MSQIIKQAKKHLLTLNDIEEQHLEKILNQMMGHHIDLADLYFQHSQFETWSIEDSVVKGGSFNIDMGVGIRAVSGEKTGFAYSDDISYFALQEASKAAKSIALDKTKRIAVPGFHAQNPPLMYGDDDPIANLSKKEKIAILEQVDALVRKQSPWVKQVNASLSGCYETILVVNNLGLVAADIRPLVSLHISVMMEKNGRKEVARSGGGGRGNYQAFFDVNSITELSEEAVKEALVNMEAKEAPAGTMPVVLGPGWPGVLLHEAVGHGLEGDFNRKGISAYSGKIGQQVASSSVTVVDDGTIAGRRGSLTIDDEGTPSQCTTLIENGVLKGYMFDNLNAKLMGQHSTGNCRRESYAHIPMPRMTNTYMLAGQYAPEEIIKSVKKGLYAVNFGGGQVDITSGKFVFSASEAYLIEDGKVTQPVKGATLVGNGPEVMKQVSMVGNDLALDRGIGVCGKEGQSVPVGVGQPTLKIDALTVGGTQ